MAEFIRIGNRRVNADNVHAATINEDGSVTLNVIDGPVTLTGDEATAFVAWLGTVVLNPLPDKPGKPHMPEAESTPAHGKKHH